MDHRKDIVRLEEFERMFFDRLENPREERKDLFGRFELDVNDDINIDCRSCRTVEYCGDSAENGVGKVFLLTEGVKEEDRGFDWLGRLFAMACKKSGRPLACYPRVSCLIPEGLMPLT